MSTATGTSPFLPVVLMLCSAGVRSLPQPVQTPPFPCSVGSIGAGSVPSTGGTVTAVTYRADNGSAIQPAGCVVTYYACEPVGPCASYLGNGFPVYESVPGGYKITTTLTFGQNLSCFDIAYRFGYAIGTVAPFMTVSQAPAPRPNGTPCVPPNNQSLPGQFSKVAPVHGTTELLPLLSTLSWSHSTNTAKYLYCLDAESEANNVCDSGWNDVGTTAAAPVGLAPNTRYSWQVYAQGANGQQRPADGGWWSFTTGAICQLRDAKAQWSIGPDGLVRRPTHGDAGLLEAAAPNPPLWSVYPQNGISEALNNRVTAFENNYNFLAVQQGKPALVRTSGYRPHEYQAHLRSLFDLFVALRRLPQPLSDACERLSDDVHSEIHTTHRLYTRADGSPAVSEAGSSAHEPTPAAAVDLGNLGRLKKHQLPLFPDRLELKAVLALHELTQPYGDSDPVHVALAEAASSGRSQMDGPAPANGMLIFETSGPVNILVTDPLGRRVGFDAVSAQPVNEVGESDASYLGPGPGLQVIAIFEPVQGNYSVSGIGVGSGPYTISIERLSSEAEIITASSVTGTAAPGGLLQPNSISTASAPADETRPLVTPPLSIGLSASEPGGARGTSVPALAAFLIGATATDNSAQPLQQLSPQVSGVNVGTSTLFPIGVTTVTFAFQDASLNIGTASASVTVQPWSSNHGANLIKNGSFIEGMNHWSLFATPEQSYIDSAIVGERFQFSRIPPPAGMANQAVVFQATGAAMSAGAPLLAKFDLGNTSSTRKRISVLVLDADFSDLHVCTFWLAPNAPARTYEVRSHSTKSWSSATIAFYAASVRDDGGFYTLDNVSLTSAPSLPSNRTDCVDPTRPAPPDGFANPTLLTNGTFGAGMSSWGTFGQIVSRVAEGVLEFYRPAGTPAGVVLQATGTPLAPNEIVSSTFDLGNGTASRKRVTVLLHDNAFGDQSACTFWLAPNQPLSRYEIRTFATRAWSNATFSAYAATVGVDQWVRLDNVSLQQTPSEDIQGTECIEPPDIEHAATQNVLALPRLHHQSELGPTGSEEARSAYAPSNRADAATSAYPSQVGAIDSWLADGFRPLDAAGHGWLARREAVTVQILERTEDIDLTMATAARLRLSSWLAGGGVGRIEVTSDGGTTWETLLLVAPSDAQADLAIELKHYLGGRVRVRFVLDAAGAGELPGLWFVEAIIAEVEPATR